MTQTGEQIIFAVNETDNTVQVDIQINYQGLAEDFAWLLPLTDAPLEIQTGSSIAFQIIAQQTSPRFNLRQEQRGRCSNDFPLNSPSGGSVDPFFDFRGANSTNVSNQHNATLITTCNDNGDAVRRQFVLEDGTVVELDAMSSLPASTLNEMPAVITVSDLNTGVVLVDNHQQFRELGQQRPIKACHCSSSAGANTTAWAGCTVLGIWGFLRRRTRQRSS